MEWWRSTSSFQALSLRVVLAQPASRGALRRVDERHPQVRRLDDADFARVRPGDAYLEGRNGGGPEAQGAGGEGHLAPWQPHARPLTHPGGRHRRAGRLPRPARGRHGMRLFEESIGRLPLRLTDSRTLSTGVVALTYAP